MKCSFCGVETLMTCRNNEDKLFNCCKQCYESSREVKIDKEGKEYYRGQLWLSCIYKPANEGSEFNEERNHRLNNLGAVNSVNRSSNNLAKLISSVEGLR